MTSDSNDIEKALAAIEAKEYSTAFAMLRALAERPSESATQFGDSLSVWIGN
jgi:hypothetical protein